MAETQAPMTPMAPDVPIAPKKFPVVPVLIGIAVLAALYFLFRALPIKEWLVSFQHYVKGLGFAG